MENVIVLDNIGRTYKSHVGILKKTKKDTHALKGISFKVKRGEIFGILGPNGSGKTTLIKILTTMLVPTYGTAKILGYNTSGDEKKLRPKINFVFGGERGLYWRLSGRDNLIYFAELYKIPRKTIDERVSILLELVNLSDRADEKVENYSKGMIQRLQIARGLINDPDILFLDEATIGLDPIAANNLRKIVAKLAKQGKTIVLTTHYMFEAEELCNRIAIIKNGDLIALDTPENLKKYSVGLEIVEVSTAGTDDIEIQAIKDIEEVDEITVMNNGQTQVIKIFCDNKETVLSKVKKILSNKKFIKIDSRDANLEDAYLKLVGDDKC